MLSLLLLLFTFGNIRADNDKSVEKNVYGKSIVLPAPKGYSAACENAKKLKELLKATQTKAQLLTCFVPTAKWNIWKQNKKTNIMPMLIVSFVPYGKEGKMTISQFNDIQTMLISTMERALEQITKKMAPEIRKNDKTQGNITGSSIKSNIPNIKYLGNPIVTKNSITYGVIRRQEAIIDGKNIYEQDVMIDNYVLLKGVLVKMVARNEYTGESDVQSVLLLSRQWISNLLKNNN